MTRRVGILRRLSDQLAQKLAGARRQVMAEPVVGPDAVLLAVDQARLLEPGHVVRDRRLAQLEVRGEVADADRRFRLPEGRDHRQPSRIGKRFHQAGRLLRPPDVDRRQHAALATLAEDGKLLERHRSDDTQPIDKRRCLVLACNPSTFIDGPKENRMSDVREAVRSRYANVARQLVVVNQPGSGPDGCCQADGPDCGCSGSYSAEALQEIGLTESVSLGCGNPTMLAELKPGETVLDLGSGAGLDVLLSARRVAPGGRAYGLDMTDEMLALANSNKDRSGVTNATFLKGTIESIPLPDATVDVVISNCVINLAEDKGAVIKEAFRVLRPGGRFAVADMVELEPLEPDVKQALDQWAGCISGTIPIDEYRHALVTAGFADVDFEIHATENKPGVDGKVGSAYIRARKPLT